MSDMDFSGLSEEIVSRALTRNRGDLIMTAESLGIRPSKLVKIIKSVPSVGVIYGAIEEVKSSGEFEARTQAAFAREIQSRIAAYRLDGLEVIHEIATTEHKTAAEADVRLKAAIALRGTSDSMSSSGNDEVLAELNAIYHQSAPRIKSLRAVQIEFSDEPASLPLER